MKSTIHKLLYLGALLFIGGISIYLHAELKRCREEKRQMSEKLHECLEYQLATFELNVEGKFGQFYPSELNKNAVKVAMLDRSFSEQYLVKNMLVNYHPASLWSRFYLLNNVAPESKDLIELAREVLAAERKELEPLTEIEKEFPIFLLPEYRAGLRSYLEKIAH